MRLIGCDRVLLVCVLAAALPAGGCVQLPPSEDYRDAAMNSAALAAADFVPLGGEPARLDVQADRGWQDTGVQLEAGDAGDAGRRRGRVPEREVLGAVDRRARHRREAEEGQGQVRSVAVADRRGDTL